MDLNKINKVHLIGLGGIGVSAVAKWFLAKGKTVFGSDLTASPLTEDLANRGVKVFYGHEQSNLPAETNLVIYSPAVLENNPERRRAQELNIDQLSYPEFLGRLSHNFQTIAVAGTNGKSTTTAMIGKIFEQAGLDPTVIVGTQVPLWDGNLRLGHSKILIVEACEWKAHMLNLSPQAIVLTNLEPDHLDFYKNLEDLKHYFQLFINHLPLSKGLLVYNADDPALEGLVKKKGFKVRSYGLNNPKARLLGKNLALGELEQSFTVGETVLSLKIPGRFNVYNALAATALSKAFHIKDEDIQAALLQFPNCWRRFEILGPLAKQKQAVVISDYAHHPTAIKGTIKAAKEFYPKARLLVVFQPHHYDRTAKLFFDFAKSFGEADLLVINEIYDVAGREKDGLRTITAQDLADQIKQLHPQKEIIYSGSLAETKKIVLNLVKANDLVLIMGAGDIDQVARELVNKIM